MRFLLIDAFAVGGRAFSGNPAGVVPLDAPRDAEWMQSVATEVNQAETAFVVREPERGEDAFAIRWFTPAAEVALCGHATLAAVAGLDVEGLLPASGSVRFRTEKAGELGASRGGSAGSYRLSFPLVPATEGLEDGADEAALIGAAAGKAVWRGKADTGGGQFDAILVLESPEAVLAATPDVPEIARALATYRALAVTARGAPKGQHADAHYCSRLFAPQVGIDEDSFTGSSHCYLAPFWAARLGVDAVRCVQLSSRRGAASVGVDRASGRVSLEGEARVFLRGEMNT